MEASANTGFGRLILAVVCPPLYFFVRAKPVVGAIHGFLYFFALITIIFGVGFIFWLPGMLHAWWDFMHMKQEQVIQRQATVIAEKMVEKQRAL